MKNWSVVTKIVFYYVIPVIFIAGYLISAFQEVHYGLNRDYAEGTTLALVEKWRAAESPRTLYSQENLDQDEIIGYPALHLGLVSALSHDANSALSSGRILSATSALLLAIIAGLILMNAEIANIRHLPLIATLILYQTAIFDWSLLARSDLLAALLETLGIYFYLRSLTKEKTSYLVPFVCFVLAFFCKQNFIIGPIAIFIFEVGNNPRGILKSMPIYIAAAAGVFLLISYGFGFTYWEHTVTQLAGQSFHISRLLQMVSSYLISHLGFVLLAGIAFAFLGKQSKTKDFLFCWAAASCALALIGLGRSGSNFNYFINLSIPLAILSFMTIQTILEWNFSYKSAGCLFIILAFLGSIYMENQNLSGRLTYLDHRSWPPSRTDPEKALRATRSHLEEIHAKSVFCDEPGICALLGYTPKYTYFESKKSAIDYDTLLLMEYPSDKLAWTKIKLPDGFMNTIQDNYELHRISDLGFIFTRRR